MNYENELIEKKLENIFTDYLNKHGYNLSQSNLQELIEIYQDLQEWEDDVMVTGTSSVEMIDWIKHTKEVNRLDGNNCNFIESEEKIS